MSEQMISALPDVTRTELIPGADEFLVIACDGIWNAMSSQAVVDFIYDRLHPESASSAPPAQSPKSSNPEGSGSAGNEDTKEASETPIDRSSPAFLGKICEEVSHWRL